MKDSTKPLIDLSEFDLGVILNLTQKSEILDRKIERGVINYANGCISGYDDKTLDQYKLVYDAAVEARVKLH